MSLQFISHSQRCCEYPCCGLLGCFSSWLGLYLYRSGFQQSAYSLHSVASQHCLGDGWELNPVVQRGDGDDDNDMPVCACGLFHAVSQGA